MALATIQLELQAVGTALAKMREMGSAEEKIVLVSKAQAMQIASMIRQAKLDTTSLVVCMRKIECVPFTSDDKTFLLETISLLLQSPEPSSALVAAPQPSNATQKWEHCVHGLTSRVWESLANCKTIEPMAMHLADLGLYLPCEKTFRAMGMAFLLATEGTERALRTDQSTRKQTVDATKAMWRIFIKARAKPNPVIWEFRSVSEFQIQHPDNFDKAFSKIGLTPQGPPCSPTEWTVLVQGTKCRGPQAAGRSNRICVGNPSGKQLQQLQLQQSGAQGPLDVQQGFGAMMPMMAAMTQMCQQMMGQQPPLAHDRTPSNDELDLLYVGGDRGAGGAGGVGGVAPGGGGFQHACHDGVVGKGAVVGGEQRALMNDLGAGGGGGDADMRDKRHVAIDITGRISPCERPLAATCVAKTFELQDGVADPGAMLSPQPDASPDDVTKMIEEFRGENAITAKHAKKRPAAAEAAGATVSKKPPAAGATVSKKPAAAAGPETTHNMSRHMLDKGYVRTSTDAVTLPKQWSVWMKPPRPDKYFVDGRTGNRYRSVCEVKKALGRI
jgi:hypothetical protein